MLKNFIKKIPKHLRLLSYILPPKGNFSRLVNETKIWLLKDSDVLSSRPRKLGIYITSICNLSCHMCGYHSNMSTGEYRTKESGSFCARSDLRDSHIRDQGHIFEGLSYFLLNKENDNS